MNRKTSDVLALAVADPRYLADWVGFTGGETQPFLCNLLGKLCMEGIITNVECVKAKETIEDSIHLNCTLYSYMGRMKVRGYKAAACSIPKQPNDIRIQFWAMLCMRLKAQGK